MVEAGRVLGEEPREHFLVDFGERIGRVRRPYTEEVAATGAQHPGGLAEGCRLVGEEHHPELADHEIELRLAERQRHRVGLDEFDALAAGELAPCHRQHRRVEVGDHQPRRGRQGVAEPAADDAGAGGELEDVAGRERRGAPGQIVGGVDEDHRTEAGVVVLRDAADELGGGLHRAVPQWPHGGVYILSCVGTTGAPSGGRSGGDERAGPSREAAKPSSASLTSPQCGSALTRPSQAATFGVVREVPADDVAERDEAADEVVGDGHRLAGQPGAAVAEPVVVEHLRARRRSCRGPIPPRPGGPRRSAACGAGRAADSRGCSPSRGRS